MLNKEKETVENYLKHMKRYYRDFSNVHDRLIRFCAEVIVSEIRRNGSNHFQAVISLIENGNWGEVSRCLMERYGNASPMNFLRKHDLGPNNRANITHAFSLAWNQSPLYEEDHRQLCYKIAA